MSVDITRQWILQDFSGKGFLLKQEHFAEVARPAIHALVHCLFRPVTSLTVRVDKLCLLEQ